MENFDKYIQVADKPEMAFVLGVWAGGKGGAMVGGNVAKFAPLPAKPLVLAGCSLAGGLTVGCISYKESLRRKRGENGFEGSPA